MRGTRPVPAVAEAMPGTCPAVLLPIVDVYFLPPPVRQVDRVQMDDKPRRANADSAPTYTRRRHAVVAACVVHVLVEACRRAQTHSWPLPRDRLHVHVRFGLGILACCDRVVPEPLLMHRGEHIFLHIETTLQRVPQPKLLPQVLVVQTGAVGRPVITVNPHCDVVMFDPRRHRQVARR